MIRSSYEAMFTHKTSQGGVFLPSLNTREVASAVTRHCPWPASPKTPEECSSVPLRMHKERSHVLEAAV